MDKKSAKIIGWNLRNVKQAPHVPKRDMCSSLSLPQNSEMFQTRPDCVFADLAHIWHWVSEWSNQGFELAVPVVIAI